MKINNSNVNGVNVTTKISGEVKCISAVVNGVGLTVIVGDVDPSACAYVQFANTGVMNWVPVFRGARLVKPTDAAELAFGLSQSADRWLSAVLNFTKTKMWPRDLVVGTRGSAAIPHGSMLWRFGERGVCDDIRKAAYAVAEATRTINDVPVQ